MRFSKVAPTGAELLVSALENAGVGCVFGMPASRNVAILEALRHSAIRTVVGTSELAASFMANGYARASGRPGVLVTMAGPGFTCALTGVAEAFLGSVPMVYVLLAPVCSPGRRYRLQAIDQSAMVAPVCKAVIDVAAAGELPAAIDRAFLLAQAGEPGPVVVHVEAKALGAREAQPPASARTSTLERASPEQICAVAARVSDCARILIYAGQGAAGDPDALHRLASKLGALVATTTSARGVIAEDCEFVIRCDRDTARLSSLLERADLVLALGAKFTHNGAHGFRLKLRPERLVHVDSSAEVLNGHYPAAIAIAGDVPDFMRRLRSAVQMPVRPGWTGDERAAACDPCKPPFHGDASIREAEPATPAGFFSMLRKALPRDAVMVTDAGLHQTHVRRHYQVLAPRGLIIPTGIQSMGFGVSAAIGATLAAPGRRVVAVIGDGGLAMAGMELLTAVRENLRLLLVVFVDGHLGEIRQQQLARYGHPFGTRLQNPDFEQWALSLGVRHIHFTGATSLATAIAESRPTLLEVTVNDSRSMQFSRLKRLVKNGLGAVTGLGRLAVGQQEG